MDDDDVLFLLGCLAATVLGISLLIGRSVLDLGMWSVVLGLLCLGGSGPFVFGFLAYHAASPLDRLIRGFGFALPGGALLLIGVIVRATSHTPEVRDLWAFVMIFCSVWIAVFFGGGLTRYLWLRRYIWYDTDEEGEIIEETARSGGQSWSSYEWTSLLVAVISAGASVGAVLVEVAK